MAVYSISILNPNDGSTVDQTIGAMSDDILMSNESKTLTDKLRTLTETIDSKANKTTATTTVAGLMSASDKQKLDNLSTTGYSLPVASNQILGGVLINTGAGIGIDASGHYLTNLGVRSIGTGGSAGTISVNTGGSVSNVKVNGWDSIAWIGSYSANSFAPANYQPAASAIKVGSFVANMKTTNSASLDGMIRNIQYTNSDPGAGTANSNNGLLICVYE